MSILKALLSAAALCGLIAGCSPIPLKTPGYQTGPVIAENSETGWWYARFRNHWPEESKPLWHMDVLLAHQVILPVLDRHQEEIDFWRFHRRAGRDGAGHQFSFIFYARADTAREIYRMIEADETLRALVAQGKVEKLILDDTAKAKKPHIQDTSDPVWNEIIQKAWPHYIMGVSKMWLDMIDRLVTFNSLKNDSPVELYRNIQLAMTKLWKNEGSHAFLHHLNGLFAYKPMVVLQRNLMAF